jgi:hypothetical protein
MDKGWVNLLFVGENRTAPPMYIVCMRPQRRATAHELLMSSSPSIAADDCRRHFGRSSKTNTRRPIPSGRSDTHAECCHFSLCMLHLAWRTPGNVTAPSSRRHGRQLEFVNKLCSRRVSQYIQKGTAVACWIESDANLRPHAPTKRIDLG